MGYFKCDPKVKLFTFKVSQVVDVAKLLLDKKLSNTTSYLVLLIKGRMEFTALTWYVLSVN
jgi:hypothetical protein